MEDQQNSEHLCYNCRTELPEKAAFCPSCGQKNTTGKIDFWDIIKDFFEAYLNINARFPKTIFALFFSPGKLTVEFFQGRHKSFMIPSQLFIIATGLLLTVLAIKSTGVKTNINYSAGRDDLIRLVAIDSAKQEVDSLLQKVKSQGVPSQTKAILDTAFSGWLEKDPALDDYITFDFIKTNVEDTLVIKVLKRDVYLLSDRDIAEKYGVKSFWEKLLLRQSLRYVKNEDNFVPYLISRMSWAFFIFVPFFALVLKLVYVRKKRFYVEHLVFTFHFHAFLFLLFSIALLFADFMTEAWSTVLFTYLLIYLFIAMKRFYQQSWLKTFFKLGILLFLYFILFVIAAGVTIFVTFVLY